MKDLKTLCNVNIPNSLHSLLEASILDIEGTIEEGDLAINQFEDLKKFVLDKNNWKQTGSGRSTRYIEINYEKPINMLVKCLHINNPEIKYIQFKFYRTTMMKYYKGGTYLWGNKDYQIHYDPNSAHEEFERDVNIKTPQDILTKVLKPIFKDFETFIKTINTTLDK